MSDSGWVMNSLEDFEEMEVWQSAQALAVSVYKDFFSLKDTSFCDQIKRAVVSISKNIAKGAERTTSVEFARFLDIAKGSTGKVRSIYKLAERLEYCASNVANKRCETCLSISRQLGGFA
jgi:four helix bundle protein